MHNDLANRIAANRRKARKLENEICELLTEAAQLACDAGHVSGGVAAAVVAPK